MMFVRKFSRRLLMLLVVLFKETQQVLLKLLWVFSMVLLVPHLATLTNKLLLKRDNMMLMLFNYQVVEIIKLPLMLVLT
eukprot:jgi/Orpsp1_1/1181655/evm.model.c7180000078097.1